VTSASLTVKERILLYLLERGGEPEEYNMSPRITQIGIGDGVGVRRCNAARALGELKADGYVEEHRGRVQGSKRRMKGYTLGVMGRQLANDIQQRISETTVMVRGPDGAISEVKVSEVSKLIKKKISTAEVLARTEQGVFDAGAPEAHRRFIGRQEEMGRLKELLRNAQEGKGATVLISGEAGIGKTRLTTEFRHYAASEGALILSGACLYQRETDPYMPFAEALRKLPVDRMHPIPFLQDVAGTPAHFGDANFETTKIYERTSRLISTASEERPVLLIIDDLHWADRPSAMLMHYLAHALKESRVLTCGTYRPEDLNEEGGVFGDILKRMSREHLFVEMPLARLDYVETVQIAGSIIGLDGIGTSFAKGLYKETEGNPLFIEEVLRTFMTESSTDRLTPEALEKVDFASISMPRTIRDVIQRRVERLDPGARRIIEVAAVIGEHFRFPVITIAAEMDEIQAAENLETLLASELIKEDEGRETYSFTHGKIRAEVYYGMSQSKRRILHKRVGLALDEDGIDRMEVYDLARHFWVGGEYQKGLKYAMEAGKRSTDAMASEQALGFYKMALGFLLDMGEGVENYQKRSDTLINIGDNYQALGKVEAAQKAYGTAQGLAHEIDDKAREARALERQGEVFERLSQYEGAIAAYEEGLELAEEGDSQADIARIRRGMGKVRSHMGRYGDAITNYNIASETYAELGDALGEASAAIDKANTFKVMGKIDEAEENIQKGLEYLTRTKNLDEEARAYNTLGTIRWNEGDIEGARDWYKKCVSISDSIDNVRAMAYGLLNLGYSHLAEGEGYKAESFILKARPLFERMSEDLMIHMAKVLMGRVRSLQGDWDEAVSLFQAGVEGLEALGSPANLGLAYLEMGQAYAGRGETETARRHLEEAERIFDELDAGMYLARTREELEKLPG